MKKYFWSYTGYDMPVEISEEQYAAIREYGKRAVFETCSTFGAFERVAGELFTVKEENLKEFYRITKLREGDDWKSFFRPKTVQLSGMITYHTKGLTL